MTVLNKDCGFYNLVHAEALLSLWKICHSKLCHSKLWHSKLGHSKLWHSKLCHSKLCPRFSHGPRLLRRVLPSMCVKSVSRNRCVSAFLCSI
jgi:hypothetical protein